MFCFRTLPTVVAKRRLASHNESYSRIIVGAGSAGCVLANRLSASSDERILLVEAGPSDSKWQPSSYRIHMPGALLLNFEDDKYNWRYYTAPQKHLDGRSMRWPRGRVWGGSSSLNAMVYIRGHPLDYNRWETEGATGWSYAHCLPYFKKSQNHHLGANDYRGANGPLHVTSPRSDNPLYRAFIDAGVQAGYPVTDDMNGVQQEGFGWYDFTIKNGARCSVSQAFLRPALAEHKNLSCLSNALVNKCIMKGGRVVGVEVTQNGEKRQITADKEVILCGGAINSPQLLMLSGIGDGDDLRKVGIEPVYHLPGVGRNMQDHLLTWTTMQCREPITLNREQGEISIYSLKTAMQWLLRGSGDAASTHVLTGAFIRSSAKAAHPDVQITFLPSPLSGLDRSGAGAHAFQALMYPCRPASRGRLTLNSADPRAQPHIDANCLAAEQDRKHMRMAIGIARRLFRQPALEKFANTEVWPGEHAQSDVQLDAYVREQSLSGQHTVGTCKMGCEKDPLAVVDPQLRVLGVEGLRVVDASVMPSLVSGNTNAPAIMIAERAADLILGRPPLPPSAVSFR